MNHNHACWPIIYVRGYAMTGSEIDETTADPFCGFNTGSTVYRATSDKKAPPKKFVFESPVVRLGNDFGYRSVFDNGLDIVDKDWERPSIPRSSIVIFRYYEQASSLLGDGKTPSIGKFSADLCTLILRVRELVCAHEEEGGEPLAPEDFRCYLVAHSMGGLVCRALLHGQVDVPEKRLAAARAAVDKVFTYATPHNGIEMGGINVPAWLSANDISNFNRDEMAKYLNLSKFYKGANKRVDWLPEEAFPSDKFFCLIGTNRSDYEVAKGLSRTFVGHGSDGLVRIENASVWGIDNKGKVSEPCATAYAYRAHSGYFGIVNSEEGYQNLTRFLFGDLRADIWLDVTGVRLPKPVQQLIDDGEEVNALYQFEALAAPRGKRWYLTRRVAEEDSVGCRTLKQLRSSNASDKSLYLSTVFLANRAKTDPNGKSLAYALTVGVRVPDYEVEGRFWRNQHYEGSYLFRDTVIVEIFPPEQEGGAWKAKQTWTSTGVTRNLPLEDEDGRKVARIPFTNKGTPGIDGTVRLLVRRWNGTA